MTYTILAFLHRKPGTTMEEYMHYYDNNHMRVLREITGAEHFPISHTRHYIHRTESPKTTGGLSTQNTPATLFKGQQTDVDFDCVAVVIFQDEAAFQGFNKAISSPENAAKLDGDEIVFQDATKTTVALAAGVCAATKDEK